MNCREARDLLGLLLDAALDEEEAASLEEHLDGCAVCREEQRNLSATVDLIRDIPRPPAPEGFAEEVLARLPARPAKRGSLLRFVPVAAAAALLLTAVILISRDDRRSEDIGVTDVAVRTSPETLDRAAGKPESRYEQPRDDSEAAGDVPRMQPEVVVSGRRAARPSPEREEAPGMREPLDPEQPPDVPPIPPAAAPPGAPPRPADAPSRVDADKPEGEWGMDRRYVLSGVSPDAAAGQIWAELVHLRRGRGRFKEETLKLDEPEKESIEADADGEPNRMVLCVTEGEMDLIAGIFNRRPGARFKRTNGGEHKSPRGDDDRPLPEDHELRRLRVEILLRR